MRISLLLAILPLVCSTVEARQAATVVWVDPIPTPSTMSSESGLAVDREGTSFVSSGKFAGGNLSCYDADLTLRWRVDYPVDSQEAVFVTALAADGLGGVYAAGETLAGSTMGGPPLGRRDGFIARYAANGTLQWSRRVGGTEDESLRSIVVDPSGDVLIAGSTKSDAPFAGALIGRTDGFAARYDSLGNELWVSRVGETDHTTTFTDLDLDGTGGLICAGSNWDPAQVPYILGAYARLAGDGSIVYERLGSLDPISCVKSSGDGGFFGISTNSFGGEHYLVRVDMNGVRVWSTLVTVDGRANDLFVSGSSLVVVGGTEHGAYASLTEFSDDGLFVVHTLLEPHLNTPSELWQVSDNGFGTVLVSGERRPFGAARVPIISRLSFGGIGAQGCLGEPNSTGMPGRIEVLGNSVRSLNSVTLFGSQLPNAAFGYFLCSLTSGFVPNPGASQGNLCLGGAIGRLNRIGESLSSGAQAKFHVDLDLGDLPTPSGSTSAAIGQTWWFQGWYRDANPQSTSNFTGSISVTFE